MSGPPASAPIGVVLAGGGGRRIGGDKALVTLGGRPLIAYPLDALKAVLPDVAVVAKVSTRLPALGRGVELWTEPEEPQHPLVGIVEALRHANGRAVLVCACDMPLLTDADVRLLTHADAGGAPAVVAVGVSGLQPMLARYEPRALPMLAAALTDLSRPLRATVRALAPARLDVSAEALFNVNAPEDLVRAEAILAGRAGAHQA